MRGEGKGGDGEAENPGFAIEAEEKLRSAGKAGAKQEMAGVSAQQNAIAPHP